MGKIRIAEVRESGFFDSEIRKSTFNVNPDFYLNTNSGFKIMILYYLINLS